MYSQFQQSLIHEQFDEIIGDHCYLDHAASTLYGKKQIENMSNCFLQNIYSNPHTQESLSSELTNDIIKQIRLKILSFFNTNPTDYSVIFTSNATHAIKLIGESFFESQNKLQLLAYLKDNHSSVLGLRYFVENFIAFNDFNEWINYKEKITLNDNIKCDSLFVYPAQSNFCGYKYPFEWIEEIENSTNWLCLLDAASYVCTNPLNLSKYRPSFICISFYKLFGLPTGLGALLVKNSRQSYLTKRYSGGGTYLSVSETNQNVVLKNNFHEKFEDGTLNYLAILVLQYGFSMLEYLHLDMYQIQDHVFCLAKYLYEQLNSICHFNGTKVVNFYTKSDFSNKNEQGSILNFNLLQSNGQFVGFNIVANLAKLYKIHLRTGCCCNPGACNFYLNISSSHDDNDEKYNEFFSSNIFSHYCLNKIDLYNGFPTGSIRISFGYMSRKSDADYFLKFINENFVEKIPINPDNNKIIKTINPNFLNGKLSKIFIYPVKSCRGFQVNQWQINKIGGLMFDRVWAIIQEDKGGAYLNQKIEPKLAMLKCTIDLNTHVLELSYSINQETNDYDHKFRLKYLSNKSFKENKQLLTKILTINICSSNHSVIDCGDEVANWLSKHLNRNQLRLIQRFDKLTQYNDVEKIMSNQSDFLLINYASVRSLQYSLNSNEYKSLYSSINHNLDSLVNRFRPNFLLETEIPFIEQFIDILTIYNKNSSISFKNIGPCNRCTMICIDQTTSQKNIDFYKFLCKLQKKRVEFGINLELINNKHENIVINVDQIVHFQLRNSINILNNVTTINN